MTNRSAVRGELIAYATFGKRMTPCMRQFSADGRAKGGKMKRYELLRLAIRTRAYTLDTSGCRYCSRRTALRKLRTISAK